jgi:hypothetical protein
MNWIPVEERLPEPGFDVIVWLGSEGYKTWDTGWYDSYRREWIDSRDEVCYPTHWYEIEAP